MPSCAGHVPGSKQENGTSPAASWCGRMIGREDGRVGGEIKGVIAFGRPPSEMRHRVVQNRTQSDKSYAHRMAHSARGILSGQATDDPTVRWGV